MSPCVHRRVTSYPVLRNPPLRLHPGAMWSFLARYPNWIGGKITDCAWYVERYCTDCRVRLN